MMEFLKKHYEKMVLCVVLLGLAGAVAWMSSALKKASEPLEGLEGGSPPKKAPLEPLDLTADQRALAQITNPPPVVLSGEHNLFNPVTWKCKANGELLKIIKTGPDALTAANSTPRYTIIAYDRPTDSPVYVMNWQRHADLRQPGRGKTEYARKDEKMASGLYIVRGIKGAENDPSEINLEIIQTGQTNVWVSTNTPYKYVDSHLVDLKYDPDPSLPLLKRRVNDEFNLDNEPYKIVEITNDVVRVQNIRTTKVTEIKVTQSK
jgi:hypothetical protein